MYDQRISLYVIILMVEITSIGCTNTSTVCYGVLGISCSSHKLSCPSPLVIQIIDTSYGYRPGCNQQGLSSCTITACCNEEPGDCFIPFSCEDQQAARNCNGKETCKLQGLRRYNNSDTVCNGREVSAYSKIQYDCVTNGDADNVAGDADNATGDADNVAGSIVGGIIGAIIIIVLIVLVVLFLYKRKKNSLPAQITHETTEAKQITRETTQATSSSQYHVIDGPGSYRIHNDNSGYDEIELDSPKYPSPDDHIEDDQLTIKSPRAPDNYNHIGKHNDSLHEDDYHHIGNNLPTSPSQFNTDYNHITGVLGSSNVEDDYNHIDNNDNKKGESVNSTACYGTSGLLCSSHMLLCVDPLVIQIINTTYGYRPECNDLSGKSHCQDSRCCREKSFDCFVSFLNDDSDEVHKKCNGYRFCKLNGKRHFKGAVVNAYSRIQYDCVANDTLPTVYTVRPKVQQPEIKTNYNYIVGGVIGIISVMVIIIVIIIIRRNQNKQRIKSQENNNTVLSTPESYTPHYTSIDEVSVNDRKRDEEYEDIELNESYLISSSLDDNNDRNLHSERAQSTEQYSFATQSNNMDIQIPDIDNYNHINDVRYPVGDVDDYHHIGDLVKKETIFEDNYNHIFVYSSELT